MTNEEIKFKQIVKDLIDKGIYPSPRQIHLVYRWEIPEFYPSYYGFVPVRPFKIRPGNPIDNISGKQCRWRREVCKELGFKLRGTNL